MSAHDAEFDEEAPEVFDFLQELEADRERGEQHPLSHYLVRYPGFEEAISREYLAQQAPAEPAGAPEQVLQVAGESSGIGPYRLEKEIGRGGQGVVYLAEDTRIQRRVALKLLPPAALLLSADRKARLRREAEVISRLEHPGICGIFDAEVSGELAYIAMHFVEGETLGHLIALEVRRRAGEEIAEASEHAPPLFPENEAELFRVLELFEQAARALHAAHAVGVVHRDIKPANLMVTPAGAPVWLDFGQARDTQDGAMQLTVSGEVFGTPSYMSPEQVTGHRDALDPRTDVWALAVSLFEALTLARPFEGASTHALLFAVQTEEARSARELNPAVTEELEVVLQTGLEKDLARRYASAAEFADELARIRGFEPIHARPAGTALKFRRWCRRHPLLFVSISGVVAMLVIGLMWTIYLLRLEEKALEHALGRHLAERATTLVDEDPAAALTLGIEAVQLAPSYQTRSALYTALERCYLVGEFDGDPARRFRDIALSPDGAWMVAALSDGSGRLYDVMDRSLVARWAAHEGDATAAAFSPDGARVATGDASGRVVVYDPRARAEVLRAESGGGEVQDLAFGVLGGRAVLFVAQEDAAVQALDLETGAWSVAPEEVLLAAEEAQVRRLMATVSDPDGWADWIARLEVPPTFLSVLDGGALAFAAHESAGELAWELLLEEGGQRALEEDAPAEVLDAAFSPDGRRLAVAATRGGTRLFDVATGRKLATFEGLMQSVKLLWTPDGEHVIAQTNGPFVQVWFGTQRPDVYRLFGGGGPLVEARFSGDGERAATLTREGRARIWATPASPTRSSSVGALVLETHYPWNDPRGVVLADDGSALVVCGAGGLWWSDTEGGSGRRLDVAGVTSAEFLPGDERLLVVGERAVIISAAEPSVGALVLAARDVQTAECVPGWNRVVVATAGGGLTCYDDVSGDELWQLDAEAVGEVRVVDLAFRPDGGELAVVRSDRTVRFLDMADGSPSQEALGIFPPRDADWSADGSRLLVTGSQGRGAFMVKELATDQRMRVNVFHHGNLTGGSFSPDGSLVMTSSEDGTIFVRDVLTGSPIVLLTGDGEAIRRASFGGHSERLRVIAALQDGSARIWPVDPLPGALARKPRELYEWEQAREVRLALPLEYR